MTPDVDGDGVIDFTTETGLYSGVDIASPLAVALVAVARREESGRSLGPLGGDVDGDGLGDLLLQEGEQFWVVSGTSRGTADPAILPNPGVLLSSSGGPRGYPLTPRAARFDVSGQAGDITGDGRIDLLGADVEHGEAYLWASDDISSNVVHN